MESTYVVLLLEKGVTFMSVFESLVLMITFGSFVVAVLSDRNK
ncbi:putative holin-like toxin [Oceanobacillus halophilus]|nr:putative holin-like toxin [Oceanobacillus halophilus]